MEEGADFSFDDIPGFFTNGSVDDKKYENLLEDLRAHDLLGPSEGTDDHGAASSSLFFNDAFSAIFMGQFDGGAMLSSLSTEDSALQLEKKVSTTAPPPGFAKKPPGLAPTEADLKWARGQEDFARISSTFTGAHALPEETSIPSGMAQDVDTESIDESQILSLRSLGLDDDESKSPQKVSVSQQSPVKSPAQQPGVSPPRSPPRSPPGLGAPSVPMPPPGAWQNPPMGPPVGHLPPGASMPMSMPIPGPGMMPPPPFGPGPPPVVGPFAPPPRPFKMMTPRDINFVVQQQMKQLRSSDPFSDDYYFHNFWMKRTRATQPGMPLPSWKLGHVRSIDPRDAQRANSSRQWESQHHVLGRNENRSLYTPKQLVNLKSDSDAPRPSAAERKKISAAEFAQTVRVLRMPHDSTSNSVFTNETWFRRHRIDRGLQCLLSLQEARHILDARGINVQQFHSLDDGQMDPALVELRSRTAKLLVELAAILGVVLVETSAPESAQEPVDGSTSSTHSMQCDKKSLKDMMAVQKGKKLVSRALPLLHPSARFVLFPAVMEILLGSANAASINNEDNDNQEASTKVCETLVLMLMYHPPTPPAEVFADSLAMALEGHSVESLGVILHNRPRAEVLQALLQKGADSVHGKSNVDPVILEKWNWYQDLFVRMATAIKESSV